MGSQEVLENSTIMDSTISSCDRGAVQRSDNIEEIENPGVDFLDDFDLYLDDINDRLTISRMVSDSVIKGMIGAVEQEAEEKIALKETELTGLKESLYLYHVGSEENECVSYSVKCHGLEIGNCGSCPRYLPSLLEHNRVQESLSNLKVAAEQQFKVLKKEIDKINGTNSIQRRNSSSELVGLSAILQENGPHKWIDVDKTLDGLKTTLESVCEQAEDLVHLSKSSLFEWQQEREIQAEIEGMVLKNCIWDLQEEFEQKLWDQNAQSYSNGSANWFAKIKEISSLRQELDVIFKSLSTPESGQLSSHGSLEHRKASSNHPLSTSLLEGNSKLDESIIAKPENVDLHQLQHMDKETLVNHFKTEMRKMKRHHESKVEEMTEKYIRLKGDYLRERGSTLPVRKDKEFDSVRKKIPEIISKLDDILVENEKLPAFKNNFENLENLKDRLESLHSENHQLSVLLLDKEKEIKCLLSQVSDAEEKLVEHSVTETYLLRTIANLKCAIEDARIEALLDEDIYKLILKEEMVHIKWLSQELDMEYDISEGLYENIFREAARNAELTSKLEFEDSDMEPIIMKGLLEVIYGEAFKEAEEKLSGLNRKWTSELEAQLSLEAEALEKENMLRLHHTEKEKLEEEVCALTAIIDEKDKLVREEADALAKEKEKLELSSQELDQLRVQIDQQEMLISKSSEESQVLKRHLDAALEEIEHYKGEIGSLTEMLELAKKELSKSVEEKCVLLAVSQEKQNALSLSEARERDHLEQLDSVKRLAIGLSEGLSDFEHKATEDLQRNGLRLGILSSQLSSLISKASRLKKTGLLYKEKLERRCSDLQKAEAEVDLLGDEVDNLLSLLEKIYIGLDHYSPILQHYPGIIEILKLVRRELSGESVKPV